MWDKKLMEFEINVIGASVSDRYAALELSDLIYTNGYEFSNKALHEVAISIVDLWMKASESTYSLSYLDVQRMLEQRKTGVTYEKLSEYFTVDYSTALYVLKKRFKFLKAKTIFDSLKEKPEIKFDDFESFANEIFNIQDLKQEKSVSQLVDDITNELKTIENGSNKMLTTGIKHLDDEIRYVANDDIIVIGAYSGVGKTHLLTQICNNLLQQDLRVCFITNEMMDVDIFKRLVTHQTQQNEKTFVLDKEGRDKFSQAAVAYKNSVQDRLIINYESDFEKAIGYIRAKAVLNQIDVVMIDYLQMFRSSKFFKDDRLMFEDFCKQLKDIARKYRLPLIITSQLTKTENDSDYPESFMGSSAIIRMASTALVIKRARTQNKTGKRLAKIQIVKGRRGESGIVYGYYRFPNPAFISEKHMTVFDENYEKEITAK